MQFSFKNIKSFPSKNMQINAETPALAERPRAARSRAAHSNRRCSAMRESQRRSSRRYSAMRENRYSAMRENRYNAMRRPAANMTAANAMVTAAGEQASSSCAPATPPASMPRLTAMNSSASKCPPHR